MAQIKLKGNTINTVGELPKVGAPAPDFKLTDVDLCDVSLASFKGKKKLLNIVPSLDTPTCALSTKKFNEHAAKHPNAVMLIVSVDLPFAQKRFCLAHQTDRVTCLSDYQDRTFGTAWGLQMQEGPKLLARALYVIDRAGVVRYGQVVPEITHEPDYAEAFAAVRRLL